MKHTSYVLAFLIGITSVDSQNNFEYWQQRCGLHYGRENGCEYLQLRRDSKTSLHQQFSR